MIMSVFVRRGDDDVGELEYVKDGGELGAEGIDTVRLIMTVAGGIVEVREEGERVEKRGRRGGKGLYENSR